MGDTMSHLLDSVLDPARLAAIAANDRAQAAQLVRVAALGRVDFNAAADSITTAVQALRAATLALQRRDIDQAEDELIDAIAAARDALYEVQR
jgi:hypothetical protein